MNKKEMDEIIKDPLKFVRVFMKDKGIKINEKDILAVEETIKELKKEMKDSEKPIIIDDPIIPMDKKEMYKLACKWAGMMKFSRVHDPNRFGEELIINKKEVKMKERTVKKAVRDLIVDFYNISMRFLGESRKAPFGISGWQIQTAHPKHQLSGLRKLRELKEEFYKDCLYTAYIYRRNKYYMTLDFYQWLKENYKD